MKRKDDQYKRRINNIFSKYLEIEDIVTQSVELFEKYKNSEKDYANVVKCWLDQAFLNKATIEENNKLFPITLLYVIGLENERKEEKLMKIAAQHLIQKEKLQLTEDERDLLNGWYKQNRESLPEITKKIGDIFDKELQKEKKKQNIKYHESKGFIRGLLVGILIGIVITFLIGLVAKQFISGNTEQKIDPIAVSTEQLKAETKTEIETETEIQSETPIKLIVYEVYTEEGEDDIFSLTTNSKPASTQNILAKVYNSEKLEVTLLEGKENFNKEKRVQVKIYKSIKDVDGNILEKDIECYVLGKYLHEEN